MANAKKPQTPWYEDAWEQVKAAPGQLWDRFMAPAPRISYDAQGRPFTPPKPDAQGRIRSIRDVKGGERSPYPQVDLSPRAMWKNFHPIDFGVQTLKALRDLPQATQTYQSMMRGMMLIQNEEKFNAFKKSHPKVPDAANPYYMTADKYNRMYAGQNVNQSAAIASAFGPKDSGLSGLSQPPIRPKHSFYKEQMQRDMYVARRVASMFTWVDSKGNSHFDQNHFNDAMNRDPMAVITTAIPFFGQAAKLAGSGRLAAALADLAEAGGATGTVARVVRATPRVAMIAADPINQLILPKVAGATVRAGIRMTGAGRPNIFNPSFENAWKQYLEDQKPLNPEGFLEDPAILDHAFQQFQKDTGGKYGPVFNAQTMDAMRKAGIDPASLSSPSQWIALQKNLGHTGQVVTPAGIREAVGKAGGAGTVTTSTATGESPSYLWGKAGYEQNARNRAISDVNANLQNQMGINFDPTGRSINTAYDVAQHAVDSVLKGHFAGPQTFKSKTFGHDYTYDPVADTFTFDRGSSYVPAPGKSRYVTIDSTSPQYAVLKSEAGNLATSAAVQAASKSSNPVFQKIAKEYNNGLTNPDDLVDAIAPIIQESMLDQSGVLFAGGKNSLPGHMNYQSLRYGMQPEGQQTLDQFLKQRLTLASDPRAAQQSLGVLQGKNPDLFSPDELANFNTGMNARGVVETPMPEISAGRSLIRKATDMLPNASTSALVAYVLGGGNPVHAAAMLGGNLAFKAGESAIAPLGLSDRFGAPVALNPQNWYAPGTQAIAPVTIPAVTARGVQGISNYGSQYDKDSETMRVSALPKPKPNPVPIVTPVTPQGSIPPASSNEGLQWKDILSGKYSSSPTQNNTYPQQGVQSDVKDWGEVMNQYGSASPQNRGGRIGYKKGGAVNPTIEHLVQGLMSRYKAVKKSQDNGTKPLLEQPDQAIVKALSVAQKAI